MARTPEEEARYQELLAQSGGINMDALYADYDEDEEDTGFVSNMLRGMGERATDLGGSLAGAAEDAREGLTEAMGGDFRVGYNMRGEDSGFDAGFFTPEEIKEQGTVFNAIDEALTNVDLGYEERYTLERMKEDPSISTIAGFGMETLGKSMVDMAGMYASLPLYFTARENELADERAANDGRENPTFSDYAKVAPGNAVATLMDKWSFGKLISTKGAKDLVKEAGKGTLSKEIGKRILRESATEGLIQEPAEYLSTHVGTKKGVSSDELKDVMLGGAVGGAFGGGVIGGPAAVIEQSARKKQQEAANRAIIDEADAANQAVINKGVVEEVATAPEPVVEEFAGEIIEGEVVENVADKVVTDEVKEVVEETKQATTEAKETKAKEPTTVKEEAEQTLSVLEEAKLIAKKDRELVRLEQAANKASKAVEAAQADPTNTDKKEVANDAIAALQDTENTVKVEQAEEANKAAEAKVKKEEDQATEREANRIEDNAYVNVSEGKRKSEALVVGYDAETDTYTIQKLDKKGNDKGKPKDVPAKSVRIQQDRATPVKDVEVAPPTEEDITVESAFGKVTKVEPTTTEAPVVAAKVVKTTTPTVDTTVETRAGRTLSLDKDGTTVVDQDGMPVDQSAKVRARFFKKIGKKDPELLEEGDRGLTDLQKAEKRLRSLEYQDQAQTEQGGLTPKQVAEKDKLVAKVEKLKKEEIEKIAKQVAEEETAKVEQETKAAPEGTAVEGQAEVDVVEDTIDEDAAPDIEIEEAPTPETALAASIKAMIQEEVAAQTNTEEQVVTTKAKPKSKKKAKKKKDVPLEYTSQSLDQAIEDGEITFDTALKMAQTATGMSEQEASLWLADNDVAESDLNLTDRQYEQRNGWIKEVAEPAMVEYAEANPEVFALAEQIDESNPDMSFVEAAYEAVKQHKDRTTPEMGAPSWATTPEETKQTVKDKLVNKPRTTRDKIYEVWKDKWGSRFQSKVEVVDTFEDLPQIEQDRKADSDAMAWAVRDGKIYVVADRVPEGYEEGLILHEYGVHQALRKSDEYAFVVASMEKMLENGNADVEQAYRIARTTNPDASEELIQEEAIAYLMSHNKNGSAFRTMARTLKAMAKRVLGLNMSTEDIITLVNSMVHTAAINDIRADAQTQAGLQAAIEADRAGNVEEIEAAPAPEAPEMSAVAEDAEESVDPELVTDLHTRPDTNYMTQFDIVGKTVGGLKTLMDKIKVKGLGFIPNRPLLEMLDRILPEGTRVSDVQDFYDLAEAKADQRIEKLDEDLIKPIQRYKRDKTQEYEKMVHMALRGSQLGKDMEGSTEYDTLSTQGQSFYKALRDHYKAMARDKVTALRAYTESLNIEPEKKADMLKVVNDLQKQLTNNEGYFPFNRFGEFKVEGLLPDGERYVSHHDTLRQAERAKTYMQNNNGGTFSISKVNQYSTAAKDLMTSEAYTKAKEFIDDAGGNKVAQEALWQTFLEYSPQRALQRKVASRKSIMGMSADMIRGLGLSVHRDIRFNERLKVKGEVEKVFTDVSKAIKNMDGDTIEQQELYDELKKREVVDLRASWSKNITKANFGYYLGFNPASALVNLTQNAIVAMPVIAADYGTLRTFTEMNKSFAHVAKNINKVDKLLGYEGVEGEAMKRMMADGTVNVTQAHMMTGINEGHTAEFDPDGFGSKFTKGMAFMFHNAEIANRATTAMTAFKLKYAENGNFDEALAYAKAKTFESQFDFSETGKSRFQRGDVGNVLLAMKSYPISMAVYMTQNFNRWLLDNKATPEEQRAAKTKFLGTMIATITIGGATAVPMSGLIPEVFNMLFGDDEEDPEAIVREAVYSVAGEDLGEVMLDGLVGKVTGLDLTSKVSLGLDMFARVQGGQSAKQMKEAIIEGALGPVGGMANNAVRGWDMIDEGKMAKGVTTMLPAALRNAVTGYNQLQDERSLTSRDTLIEESSTKDALMKAIGFNSEEHAEYFRKSQADFRQEDAIRKKRRVLRDMYAWSVIQGTPEERREARQAVREFNRGRIKTDQLSQASLKRSIKELRKKLRGIK